MMLVLAAQSIPPVCGPSCHFSPSARATSAGSHPPVRRTSAPCRRATVGRGPSPRRGRPDGGPVGSSIGSARRADSGRRDQSGIVPETSRSIAVISSRTGRVITVQIRVSVSRQFGCSGHGRILLQIDRNRDSGLEPVAVQFLDLRSRGQAAQVQGAFAVVRQRTRCKAAPAVEVATADPVTARWDWRRCCAPSLNRTRTGHGDMGQSQCNETRGRRAESPVRIRGVACRSCVPWLSTLPTVAWPIQWRQHERAENRLSLPVRSSRRCFPISVRPRRRIAAVIRLYCAAGPGVRDPRTVDLCPSTGFHLHYSRTFLTARKMGDSSSSPARWCSTRA